MHMESLEDDNFEEFEGGTLQISHEFNRLSNDNSPDPINNSTELQDNELNANIDTKITGLSNLIAIPKRITETLWSCRLNNNNNPGAFSRALTSSATAPGSSAFSEDDAHDYFTFRDGVVDRAVQDCAERLVQVDGDGELIGTFLLTEITTWDTEKERLVILTRKALYSVKYDFIALKKLEHRRIGLGSLDSIVLGDLVYPPASLVPRLNGLANGVCDVMKLGLLESRYSDGSSKLFEPRDRKTRGIRLLWNGGAPLAFTQKWNPFTSDSPCITFTSHPLYSHPDCLDDNQKEKFSMNTFSQQLIDVVERLNLVENPENGQCLILHKEIVLSTYLGLGSLIYNRNSLGFFKVRGKFSF